MAAARVAGPAAVAVLLSAGPAAAELPFREHVRVDPEKVVTAEACGECHVAEIEVWRETPHATGFRTLHRKEQALAIARKLGFRLIKRDSICFSCHYTPVVQGEEIRADSGVSCESCHGAGRDWIDVHNDYGGAADHRGESAEHRRQRIEASRRAGMRRPSDLYPVAANCFSCHTVPDERLVNVGGHTTGSAGFELVEWSQGQIRHNFLAASLAGRGAVNAERPMSRRRVMYVAGRALDLEYSLRGVAVAAEDGIYARAMTRRVRSAVAELRAIAGAAAVPEVDRMLEIVRGVRVVPRNEAELVAAAGGIGEATRAFLAGAEPERLAALDPLVLGQELPDQGPGQEQVAVAEPGAGGEAPAGGTAAAGPGSATGSASGPGAGGTPAARGATAGRATAGAAGAAGAVKQRLRPASRHRTIGPANCSGCHARQNEWWFADPHYRSADRFFDRDPTAVKIARLYGLPFGDTTKGRQLCMDCHGTVVSGKESRDVLDGVSCESCHGAAADWLDPHKDETDKHLGRRRPGHQAALRLGKADLGDQRTRAATCAGCHYVVDPRLLSAGHPSGREFDYAAGIAEVRHWDSGPVPPAELRASYVAVRSARGPVPVVRVAELPAGEAAALAAGGRGGPGAGGAGTAGPGPFRRGAAGGTGPGPLADPESGQILALRPPPVRPLPSDGGGPGGGPAAELTELPGIDPSAPIEVVLEQLKERLERLYRSVAGGGGR